MDNESMELYHKDKLTSLGLDIDAEFCRLVRPFMHKWVKDGCSIRALSHVMQGAVTCVELEEVLGWTK